MVNLDNKKIMNKDREQQEFTASFGGRPKPPEVKVVLVEQPKLKVLIRPTEPPKGEVKKT